jgi:hypothetical protein
VPQKRLERHLSADDLEEIRAIYGSEPVPTWGVTPGGREVNRTKWERIAPGDVVLMARNSEIFVSARVTCKTQNESLADELWGRDDSGSTWEYLYFLDGVTPQALSNAELNDIVGYRRNARVQGFNVLDEEKSAALLDALGIVGTSTEVDARSHLRSLVGRTIPTLTGRPNTILDVRSEDVIVGTDRSPQGQPVPLEWIQTAIDRLQRDGEIDINVESVGHRSAFVGAVLATLPGVRTATNPRRVTLDATDTPGRAWREPPEVEDALDAVVELAGRGPSRRQGRRQSATERKAIEMLALKRATQYFEDEGWEVEYVGGVASYDLECTKEGTHLHVEVKGTTSSGKKVLLTRNEVSHARGTDAGLALFVLADVVLREDGEEFVAESGRNLILLPWEVEDSALLPVGYEYTLPPG